MDNDKNMNLLRVVKEARIMAEKHLGIPVEPAWKNILEFWNNLKANMPQRMFMQIVDVRNTETVLSHGYELLGYKDDYTLGTPDLNSLLHENQKTLFAHLIIKVYSFFMTSPELVYKKGVCHCITRSHKANNGQYWLVHQISSPIQYDSNGITARYFSTYRILGEYKDEPLRINVYADPKFPEIEKELVRAINKIKQEILETLGFSRRQKEVILYMSIGMNNQEINNTMGIKQKTLDKHRGKIIARARLLFPVNNFQTAMDAVMYLMKQDLIW